MSNTTETKFEWTDELVREYANKFLYEKVNRLTPEGIDKFKSSKQPKQERIFSQSEVDTIRRETWEAARGTAYTYVDEPEFPNPKIKYPTLTDYLSSLNSKEEKPEQPSTVKDKEVLFATEDGVEIKESDDIVLHHVSPNFDLSWSGSRYLAKQDRGGFKIFSTKEAAEKYILRYKPVLCIDDCIIGLPGDLFKRLEQKAKQKLNQ